MALQTSLFSDDDRAAMHAAERAMVADLDRVDQEVSAVWDRATAPRVAPRARCPVCTAGPHDDCHPTCETNRGR